MYVVCHGLCVGFGRKVFKQLQDASGTGLSCAAKEEQLRNMVHRKKEHWQAGPPRSPEPQNEGQVMKNLPEFSAI